MSSLQFMKILSIFFVFISSRSFLIFSTSPKIKKGIKFVQFNIDDSLDCIERKLGFSKPSKDNGTFLSLDHDCMALLLWKYGPSIQGDRPRLLLIQQTGEDLSPPPPSPCFGPSSEPCCTPAPVKFPSVYNISNKEKNNLVKMSILVFP